MFEGLGHLVSKILMSSTQYLERIDEGGIQKMCRNIYALQQTLTNITLSREVAMDHARHYFELFYMKPEVSYRFAPPEGASVLNCLIDLTSSTIKGS